MTERMRRHRLLSDSEIELWLAVAQSVVPREGAVLPQPKPVPAAPPPQVKLDPVKPRSYAVPAYAPPISARKPALPPLAPFEKRFRRQVTHGHVEIDGAIDLHGLNQAEAHHALHGFLRGAHHRGARLVLVVTGKGRPRATRPSTSAEIEPGVLRRAVPNWLRSEAMRGIVLGFEEAGLPHGGLGALYVRLRRRPA